MASKKSTPCAEWTRKTHSNTHLCTSSDAPRFHSQVHKTHVQSAKAAITWTGYVAQLYRNKQMRRVKASFPIQTSWQGAAVQCVSISYKVYSYWFCLGSACMNSPLEGARVIATSSDCRTPWTPPICKSAFPTLASHQRQHLSYLEAPGSCLLGRHWHHDCLHHDAC